MSLLNVNKKDYMANDTKYSRTTHIPQYQIKGEKPFIQELYDNRKVIKLLDEIKKSDVSEEEKRFLTIAAYRHYVFNYEKIAEYYPHASKEMQELMEASALVIVDINDAIMNGYVKASKKIDSIIETNARGKKDEKI
jgi:F0F1-type ATP synthase delta subunit